MADLLTKNTLALWTQNDPAEVEVDPFAAEVIDKVSQMAQFLGGHPEWVLTPGVNLAPFDVQMVVLQVCKRTYSNPDQEVSSQVGPIGARVLDVAAMLLDLTDTERATLTKYNPEGDPNTGDGQLHIVSIGRDAASTLPDSTLFVPDDSLSDWYIPMFSENDPGALHLYDEEV
jgi:hypothetical protein